MIVFYSRDTGEIIGTIEGRVHTAGQLNMWIGEKQEVDRLVLDWEPVRKESRTIKENVLDDNNNVIGTVDKQVLVSIYEPKSEQKELIMDIDKQQKNIMDYKVDVQTKLLIQK